MERPETDDLPTETWERTPLFIPAYNGKHERLHDARTFIAKAGKAIGFNASKVSVFKLRQSPLFTPAFWDVSAIMREWAARMKAQGINIHTDGADGIKRALANYFKMD